MIYELSVFHIYAPRQSIVTRPYRVLMVDVLNFTQSVKHNIRTRKLVSTLNLTQSIELRTSVKSLSVTSHLNLSQSIGRNPIYLEVNHLLFHWQTIQRPKWEQVTSLLNLSQTVVGEGCRAVKSNLNLTQTVVGNVVRGRTVTHTLGLISGVSAYLADPNFNYLNPVFTTLDKVRFKFGTEQFYIRKPDFGDTYGYDLTRISRRSRGGDLIIGRDSIWPAVKSFSMTFSYLSQPEIDRLLNFMKLSLGKRCRYLNYDNVEWEGFIINPQTEATQVGRSNQTITIEFEGEPL